MFKIIGLPWKTQQGKGFHIVFPNGWTASVQWGEGNYCDGEELVHGHFHSETAEVWAWPEDTEKENPYNVQGHLTPIQVLEFLNEIATNPKK